MNTAGVIAFGIVTAIIAVFSPSMWRDETPPPPHTIRADDMDITATVSSIDVNGLAEQHLFLVTTGKGRGSVTVRFEENRSLVYGRMSWGEPQIDRTIDYDQIQGCGMTDVGPLPENYYVGMEEGRGVSRQLVATVDGKTWVTLWTESPKIDELIEKSGFTIKHRGEVR